MSFVSLKSLASGIAAAAVLGLGHSAAVANVSKDEAVAMVKKGVAAIKSMGPEKAYAEFSNPSGPWVDRDLYLVVFRLDGTTLAHGANAKQVGVNVIDRKDVDGKEFVRERMETAKTKTSFWQDYKYTNPTTKKIEPKTMYCEKQADTVVCGGIYK
ncbi:cache domain-containing protein [Aquincola sp. MAHUQ-54]|uniref:Cache domain-containing protein n=1 Tax=Aquincola agrisoli TaxID=3119538 RepID=A0AAW9QJY1_9BURK